MRKFFIASDDFISIINSTLPEVKSVKKIDTGWTNFVFVVKNRAGSFIFRFPRNDFFRKALVKEARFCKFLEGFDLKVQTPKLRLLFDKGRPFSVHKKLAGKPLNKCHLLPWQSRKVAKQVCEFIEDLAKLTCPLSLPKASTFLKNLSYVSGGGYDLSKHKPLLIAESAKPLYVTHADFNPGNILIKNGKLCAVLDFAFVSRSNHLNDLARLIGRTNKNFHQILIRQYEITFDCKVDRELLAELVSMWGYVEERYVLYIKKAHRDIVLPKKRI